MSAQADKGKGKAFTGRRLPRFSAGRDGPLLSSASDMNQLVDVLNALLNFSVKPDGNGKVVISDSNAVLDLSELLNKIGAGDPVGAQRLRVKSVQGDYLTCRTWDGTTEGAVDVLVAKPPELRHTTTVGGTWTEKVEGVTWTYTYATRTSNADGQRTAAATGYLSEVQIVEPVYHINAASDGYSEIWADQPVGGTGVSVSGTALVWMDTNRAGRAWVQVA